MYIIIHLKTPFIVKKTLHLAKERRFNINYEYQIPLVLHPFYLFSSYYIDKLPTYR